MNRPVLAATLLFASCLAAQEAPTDHLLTNPNAPASEDPVRRPLPPREDRAERGERGERPVMDERRRDMIRERMERLKDSGITREDMQRLRAALEGVGQSEPIKAIRAEAQKAREAVRAALQAYAKSKGLPTPGERPAEGAQPERPTPERMAEIRKAMEEARNDPAVKAAFERGREISQRLREAVREELLKRDATLAPILEKLGKSGDGLLELGSGRGDNAPRGPRGPGDLKGPREGESKSPREGRGKGEGEGRGPRGPRPDKPAAPATEPEPGA